MKLLFDTNSLIAIALDDHPHHAACLKWHEAAITNGWPVFMSAHSTAELYKTLTSLPRIPKISPIEAKNVIDRFQKLYQVISLDPHDYESIIDQLVTVALTGGIVYDAIIGWAAVKAGAERLVTINTRHFLRLPFLSSTLIINPLTTPT